MITWKSLNCEVCKTPYPFAVYFNERVFELINCKDFAAPYIVFEHKSKESSEGNSLFIVSFAEKQEFKIGRHNGNEIRLNDMSVSRHQAILSLDNNEIYLQDSGSKFGTSVLMQRPYILQPAELFRIQYKKTLLELTVEKFLSSNVPKGAKKALSATISYLPEECLPGGGKHHLLIIRKATYNQFLRQNDKLKRSKTPIERGENNMCPLNKRFNISINGLLKHQKTIVRTLEPSKAVKVRHNVSIIKHIGDTADDVNDQDCIQ